MNMDITDIRIRKIMQEGRLRAVISLTIDDLLAVHDIKIVQGDERLFVAMPSRRDESGTFRDIVHPITPEARKQLEGKILNAYNDYTAHNPQPDAHPWYNNQINSDHRTPKQ